jgi:elongation factor P
MGALLYNTGVLNTTELKAGATFLHHGKPFKVTKYTLNKMGRGGATVKVMTKNLENGSNEEITFSSNVKVEEISTTKKKMQYLYTADESAVFMDPSTFEQVELPLTLVEDEIPFIKEGDNANILFWDGSAGEANKALSIEIPPKATLKVVDTAPGLKGNSATNVYKPAILENGKEVKVPLFINNGDSIIVDTRDSSYVERAKDN